MSEQALENPRAALEAILMIAEEPVQMEQLELALVQPRERLEQLLQELAEDYDGTAPGARRRGFMLQRAAGGWRLAARPEHHELLGRFLNAGQTSTLSQAAMETLAIVAYRQPVSRARIAAVRGVSVDAVVRTLLLRGLIAEVDTDPTTGARLLGTTRLFLEQLGLESIDELPDLAPFLPDDEDQPEGI